MAVARIRVVLALTLVEGETGYLLLDVHPIPSQEKRSHSHSDPALVEVHDRDYANGGYCILKCFSERQVLDLHNALLSKEGLEERYSGRWTHNPLKRSWINCYVIQARRAKRHVS